MANFKNNFTTLAFDPETGFDGITQEVARSNEIMTQELSELVYEKLQEAVTADCEAVVTAAHVYERKEMLATDAIGEKRNNSYGSSTNDLLLQVTVRVSADFASEIITKAETHRKQLDEIARQAKKAELDNQIALHQAKLEALTAQRCELGF